MDNNNKTKEKVQPAAIVAIILCLVVILSLSYFIFFKSDFEYGQVDESTEVAEVVEKPLNEDSEDKEEEKDPEEFVQGAVATDKTEGEKELDLNTATLHSGAERPKEIVKYTGDSADEIDFSTEESEQLDEVALCPVEYFSPDSSGGSRLYVNYEGSIYEITNISEEELPVVEISESEINNYPVVYLDRETNSYYIYADISMVNFVKINAKYLDKITKSYSGEVLEFIL